MKHVHQWEYSTHFLCPVCEDDGMFYYCGNGCEHRYTCDKCNGKWDVYYDDNRNVVYDLPPKQQILINLKR